MLKSMSGKSATALPMLTGEHSSTSFKHRKSKNLQRVSSLLRCLRNLFLNGYGGYWMPHPHNSLSWYLQKPKDAGKIWGSASFAHAQVVRCKKLTSSRFIRWCEPRWLSLRTQSRSVELCSFPGTFRRKIWLCHRWEWNKIRTAGFKNPVLSYKESIQGRFLTDVFWISNIFTFTLRGSCSSEGEKPKRRLCCMRMELSLWGVYSC